MARKDWKYTGDINLKYGGLFFKLPDKNPIDGDRHDHVEAVEVTDLAGAVGGPDCIYRVERGTIYMPRDKWADALDSSGWEVEEFEGEIGIHIGLGEWHPIDGTGLTLLVSAFHGYCGIEDPDTATVQIGKLTAYDPDPVFEPDTFLRGNAKLERYVEREWL